MNSKINKTILTLTVLILFLTGCASSYKQGVDGNAAQYKLYSEQQERQINLIKDCYAVSTNSSECSILAAGITATQILAGRPEQIRVAKAPGEILESLAMYGMDKTVQVFGYAAVSKVISKGFDAAAKDPLVVEPSVNVVRPEIVHSGPTGASVINNETIGIGAGANQ